MISYNDIVNSFRTNPREIPTAPINGSAPKWFCVYVDQDVVCITSGREHTNACHVNPDRSLNPAEFSGMLELYQRRKSGASVSKEAQKLSLNQSYWFGVFKEMRM